MGNQREVPPFGCFCFDRSNHTFLSAEGRQVLKRIEEENQAMNKVKKLLALLLALAMVFALAACGGNSSTPASSTGSGSAEPAGDSTGDSADTPLVVGYAPFSSKFSPFFAESAYDQDAQEMTQLLLLTSDRTGAVIYNGIEGETIAYNGTDYTYYGPADVEVVENEDGTVDYNITLREDLVFSDGEPVTIDDVIFSMYVLCDPTYDGANTLYAQPIEGLAEYRQNNTTLAALLAELGEDNTDFTYVTEEQQTAFWDAVNEGLVAYAQEIVDYVKTAVEDDSLSVAAAAAQWGFTLDEGATIKDFALAIGNQYGWNFSAMEAETAGSALSDLIPEDVYAYSTTNVATGESAPNISGIIKTGDYTMTVRATQADATMIYQLGVAIAPLHYYGDESLYDYDNNSFGFPKGDLSLVREKTTEPMGAGPYKFIQFSNGVINYEANENYYLGAPKTKYVNFQEVQEADKLNGVITGTLDITDPSMDVDTADAIEQANDTGELTGNVVTTDLVDNLGYGYIGMNTHNVSVGGDPGSDASKNLRKAFGTIFSVYRDVSVNSYYAELADVINYPISNTSWAAPQPTDADYKVAFSTDVNGNDIYTSDMTEDERYAAALEAALGYFEAAGYTVENGVVTAAPEGASMEYEVMIPGDGTGNHPCFMLLTLARDALATIGINLIVTDLTQSTDLWDALDAGTCEMWSAAWQATVDPDMYQIYYSDVANGGANAGGSNYMYQIADPELDQMIMDARASTDQTYRKAMYKACLDIVVDWACEIPVYQRQNAVVFSTERVNMDTVTPDITTFYGWMMEVQNIELN